MLVEVSQASERWLARSHNKLFTRVQLQRCSENPTGNRSDGRQMNGVLRHLTRCFVHFFPTNEKSKTHVALNLMFLKVIYARARVYSWACEDFCIYSWACEGKGKRKGRRKEKEKVRAALVLLHEGAKRRIRAGGARAEAKGKKAESAAGVKLARPD